MRVKLLPATGREITDVTAALLTHASAANIKVDNPGALKATWATHCSDMPAELLDSGLRDVLKTWTSPYGLPQPGAVWKAIELPLARMKRDLAAMEKAYAVTTDPDSADAPDRKPTAETDRVIADTLKILKDASKGVKIW